jgi:hypothetical protein
MNLNQIRQILSNDKNLFFVFFSISFLMYLPSFNSRWTFDAADFLIKYEKYGLKGIWYSFYESTNTFLVSNHFIHYFVYILFGKNEILHSLFSIGWHSFNAILLIKMIKKVIVSQKFLFYFSIGTLYLTSPFHSESVVWGCNYHYLALNTCLLLLLILFHKYNTQFSFKNIGLIVFVFTFSLGLHELAFLFFIVLVFYQMFFSKYDDIKKWIPIIIFIPIILLFLYLRKLVGGDSIGHYGATVHLNYELVDSIQKFNKYLYKLFTISSMHPFQSIIHKVLDKLIWVNIVVLLSLLLLFFKLFINKIISFLVLGLVIFLLPVLNLYFVDYLYIAGDRYCTLPLIFSSIITTYLLFQFIKNSYLRNSILFFIILFQSLTLFYYNYLWYNSNKLMKICEKYNYENNINYYWLNLPESYKGGYMYKGGDGENPFLVRLKVKDNKIKTNFVTIAGMNLNSKEDGIIVEKIKFNEYKITLRQWGNWFWVGEYGASDYKNDIYSVDFDEINHSYLLKFNSKIDLRNSRMIFYDSAKIKQISLIPN